MVGYTNKPLIQKLGIKPGNFSLILNSPTEYHKLLEPLPDNIIYSETLEHREYDFIQYFAHSRKELEEIFPQLVLCIKKNGMIWISWKKKIANPNGELDENIVRDIGLSNGMVDVKVTAITDIWSGLKFVFRLENRT